MCGATAMAGSGILSEGKTASLGEPVFALAIFNSVSPAHHLVRKAAVNIPFAWASFLNSDLPEGF